MATTNELETVFLSQKTDLQHECSRLLRTDFHGPLKFALTEFDYTFNDSMKKPYLNIQRSHLQCINGPNR